MLQCIESRWPSGLADGRSPCARSGAYDEQRDERRRGSRHEEAMTQELDTSSTATSETPPLLNLRFEFPWALAGGSEGRDRKRLHDPHPHSGAGHSACSAARDIIGIAQTGTGKTASFTLPMIELLARGRAKARMPRSLILEPTRELAAQVAESFEKYGKYNKLSMALLIGGTSFDDQDSKLDRGVDVSDRNTGPPARSFRARQADAEPGSTFWSSTKPTACSTWVSFPTSKKSARSCPSRGRRCSIPRPCRRKFSA